MVGTSTALREEDEISGHTLTSDEEEDRGDDHPSITPVPSTDGAVCCNGTREDDLGHHVATPPQHQLKTRLHYSMPLFVPVLLYSVVAEHLALTLYRMGFCIACVSSFMDFALPDCTSSLERGSRWWPRTGTEVAAPSLFRRWSGQRSEISSGLWRGAVAR